MDEIRTCLIGYIKDYNRWKIRLWDADQRDWFLDEKYFVLRQQMECLQFKHQVQWSELREIKEIMQLKTDWLTTITPVLFAHILHQVFRQTK